MHNVNSKALKVESLHGLQLKITLTGNKTCARYYNKFLFTFIADLYAVFTPRSCTFFLTRIEKLLSQCGTCQVNRAFWTLLPVNLLHSVQRDLHGQPIVERLVEQSVYLHPMDLDRFNKWVNRHECLLEGMMHLMREGIGGGFNPNWSARDRCIVWWSCGWCY